MGQDLRNLFEKERCKKYPMKEGHEERFLELLDKEMPQKKNSLVLFWRLAAAVAIIISVAIFTLRKDYTAQPTDTMVVEEGTKNTAETISLGDLSPDLKKVEQYYVANINMELAHLDVSGENKALVDGYMEQLSELNSAYTSLNQELNSFGPNDQTIAALIKNLQLRLQLLHRLKEKLNELKSSKNEQVTHQSI